MVVELLTLDRPGPLLPHRSSSLCFGVRQDPRAIRGLWHVCSQAGEGSEASTHVHLRVDILVSVWNGFIAGLRAPCKGVLAPGPARPRSCMLLKGSVDGSGPILLARLSRAWLLLLRCFCQILQFCHCRSRGPDTGEV